MTLDPALRAPYPLPGDAPKQPLALVAVRGGCRRPRDEVVRGRAADWIDEGLQRFLVNVHFLNGQTEWISSGRSF